jgi:AraC-like DNA-binding protein
MIFRLEERLSDSPYVERVWRAHGERPGIFISQAAAHWEMVVTKYNGKTNLTIRGPETKATPLNYGWTGAEFFGISFKLGVFMPHLPPINLRDGNDVNLPEARSKAFWLYGSAWQFPEFENADTFIIHLIREGLLVHDPVVMAVLQGRAPTVSPRAIQKHFLHATGLTRKTIQQIERARRANALLQQGMSIVNTVHETGYFDQSHLTNSLKRFLGQTPTQVAQGVTAK